MGRCHRIRNATVRSVSRFRDISRAKRAPQSRHLSHNPPRHFQDLRTVSDQDSNELRITIANDAAIDRPAPPQLSRTSDKNTASRGCTSQRSTLSRDYPCDRSLPSTIGHVSGRCSNGKKPALARGNSTRTSTPSRDRTVPRTHQYGSSSHDYPCDKSLPSTIGHVSGRCSNGKKPALARGNSTRTSTPSRDRTVPHTHQYGSSSRDYPCDKSLPSTIGHVSGRCSNGKKPALARGNSTRTSTSSRDRTVSHEYGSSSRDLRPNRPSAACESSSERSSLSHGYSCGGKVPLESGRSFPSNPPRDPESTTKRPGHRLPRGTRKRRNTPGSPRDDVLPKRRRTGASDEINAGQNASDLQPTKDDTRGNTGSRVEPIKYKALEDICESTDMEDAVLRLVEKRERFEALLRSDEPIRPDLTKLVVRTLNRLCSSVAFKASVKPILLSSALTHFLNSHLSRFINQMPRASPETGPGSVTLITQMTELFLRLLQQMGERTANDLPLPQIEVAVRELAKQNAIQDVAEIEKKIEQVKSLKEDVMRKTSAIARVGSVGEPPQSFRDVSIVPQEEDFQNGARPFLRPNVVKGRYNDVEHYLDVQFRLLREDYLIPLREGVKKLRRERNPAQPLESSRGKSEKRRIYYDVNVLNPVCSTKRMVYRIRFDSRHKNLRRVPWQKSTRLKFGSLVCLSYDDFQTMLFATVENRDARYLRFGELDVKFEDIGAEEVNRLIVERESFEMVESEAYFEAYRHNLKALQSVTEEDLPFKEHIVHCDKDKVLPPKYLKKTSTFDLSAITDPGCREDGQERASLPNDQDDLEENGTDPSTKVPVLNLESWPTAESLRLNDSQLRACQLALTKRFAVIQGPPGTGKTYVGLKIAHALLHNAKVWQEDDGRRSPILMISYTNHALDQFLCGLVNAMPKDEIGGIVRVGGRSKDDTVKRMTLKEHRNYQRQSKQVPWNLYRRRIGLEREMREIREQKDIDRASLVLKDSRRCIFSIVELDPFMKATHWEWFHREKKPDDTLLQWLNVRRNAQRRDESREKEAHYHTDDFRKVFTTNENAENEDNDCFALRKPPKPLRLCDLDEVADPASLRRNLESRDVMSEAREERLQRRLHNVEPAQRWQLYRLWLQKLEDANLQRIQSLQPRYEKALSEHQEVLKEEDYEIFKKARVIGMTTTCAARYRETLQRLGPKIILIEEAAEVLEAHVITALTSSCEHLIMIGDHQQLRPRPNVFELAKRFNLDISLFERMVRNGIPCERLSVQHRMRPEIASLMKHVYQDLHNHESVSKFENIKGLKRNMFFIKHSNPEEQGDESHSHSNPHEARFLVALCRYLLQQGYEPSDITMLTSYTGQMFALRDAIKEEKEDRLSDVRVSTIDNFQGEESDVILLSFVRSNDSGKMGFMNVSNRTCVALSRARMGLYCIGNFDFFAQHSNIWSKIVQDLSETNSIGEALSLVCQNHGQNERLVKTADDFATQAPDGGCTLPCESRLACGHACKLSCHPFDLEHEQYRCIEPCAKSIRGCEHKCTRLCWEECDRCCQEMVVKELPCEHAQEMECGKDIGNAKCKERCEKELLCGHRCQAYCGEKCTTDCQELVRKGDWPCGHSGTVACSARQEHCKIRCSKTLHCGHSCSGTCGECRQGRVHKACKKECERLLICSHVCGQKCMRSCSPCTKPCDNKCRHSKCTNHCGELCVPCNEPCEWRCRHLSCSRLCNEMCDRPRCDDPCREVLRCRHDCRGLCGEACICAACETNDGTPITEVFLGGEDEEDALFIQLRDCEHIFAVSDLDRYMDMQDEETQAGEDVSIQLKTCPRCKTPIRRSLRYGNVVKQRLGDIEKVKKRLLGDQENLDPTKKELRSKLDKMKEDDSYKTLDRLLWKAAGHIAMTTVANKVNLLERYLQLKETISSTPSSSMAAATYLKCRFVARELDFLKKRAMSELVTEQVFCQVHVELTRLSLFIELLKLQTETKKLKLSIAQEHKKILDDVEEELSSGHYIPEEALDQHLTDIATIRKSHPSLSPLTEEERQQIVKAVGVKQGSWFKCPQGHCYAIGGCGGAMEKSNCPDCGAAIGGNNHQLDSSNSLAPEMDQAQYPAWSEQANMGNYEMAID